MAPTPDSPLPSIVADDRVRTKPADGSSADLPSAAQTSALQALLDAVSDDWAVDPAGAPSSGADERADDARDALQAILPTVLPALREGAAAAQGGGPLRVGDALVALRRLPFSTTRIADAAPAWSSGLAVERRIGPLRDRLGRPLWIDTFRRVRQLRFVRTPGGAPFLTLPLVQAGFAARTSRLAAASEIALAAGSVWFATGLVSAAPVGVMTGLRILGGRLRFSADVAVNGDEVVVPAAVGIELSLDIRQPEAEAGPDAGEFARCRIRVPERLRLSVSPRAARLQAQGEATLQAWGTKMALAPTNSAPVYRADLNRLLVPMSPSSPTYAVGDVVSTHFVPEGEAEVAEAGWALPAAVIAPGDLGDAAGAGALMLRFGRGLQAAWRETRRTALGDALLLLDETRLAFTAAAAPCEGRMIKPARAGGAEGALLQYARVHGAPVHYFTGSDGTQTVLLAAAVDLRPPMPIDVRGDQVSAWLPTALVALVAHPAQGDSLWIAGQAEPPRRDRPIAFGLTNAVLRTSLPRTALLIARTRDDGTLLEGRTFFAYALAGMLPSLPDPYAANARAGTRFGAGQQGFLISVHRFDEAGDGLEFILPPGAGIDPSTLIAGSVSTQGAAAGGQTMATTAVPVAGASAVAPMRDAGLFDFERQPRIVLLDVSSNASRFGVAVVPPRPEWREEAKRHPLQWPAVKGMDFAVDGRMLTLLTLPAVQWEPVRALPGPEPFPDEVRFANSGVPTVIDVPSVHLVPVDPLSAYRGVLENFRQPAPRTAHARFTLPFGMIARAQLRGPGPGRTAQAGEVRPTVGDLQGAHQLRLQAQDPSLAPGETAAMPGVVAQLSNALPSGGGAPTSILGGSVTSIFNGALGPGGSTPLVPVTRIDLSGHGESLFSQWTNPDDPLVGVTKVEFQVLNGRAAHEVVQVKSFLMPYFVPVVRTITLERKGNAVFTRHDSGWVAVRDGAYAHPGIATHPGVVLRATQVTNIRESGASFVVAGDEYVAAYFDTDLILDGAAAPVAARRQIGYVRLSAGSPMTVGDYVALIGRVGPMGGPVDATIAIAGGRHRMRLHRVGVGVAGSEFAMAAWGSLKFPGGGDWSVLEAEDALGAPAPVAADRGLPLVRQGLAGAPTSAPYRFADPEDLLDASNPARDYGILHAMGTQRAFYRRPRIEAGAPHRLVSSERPVLADPMLLATGVGPFPRQADGIPLPSANYALEVRGDGSWRLDAPTDFPAGIGRRTLRAAGTVRSDLDYGAAMVTYAFDTADPVPWRFALKGATRIMAHTSMGDVMTMVADIDARAGAATAFAEPQLKLGGPFDIVEDLLTVLKDLGIPVRPEVRMTNAWGLSIGFTVPFVDASGDDLKVIPGEPFPTIKFADTGLKIEFEVAPDAEKVLMELGGSPMFAIKSIPGLYVVAIIKFKLQLSTKTGTTYGVLIGVGIAYSLEAGPFELKGLFAITFFAVFGDTVLGYGIGFLVKLSADLPPIVSIELSLEGKLARLEADKGLPTETVFQIAKLVFAIEVSVFLVFSISLEVETKKVDVMRGPLLASDAPDVL